MTSSTAPWRGAVQRRLASRRSELCKWHLAHSPAPAWKQFQNGVWFGRGMAGAGKWCCGWQSAGLALGESISQICSCETDMWHQCVAAGDSLPCIACMAGCMVLAVLLVVEWRFQSVLVCGVHSGQRTCKKNSGKTSVDKVSRGGSQHYVSQAAAPHSLKNPLEPR